MTIHRDLDTLATRGVLRKTRGEVTAISSSLYEAGTEYRSRLMPSEKQAVANQALTMIEPGQAIILDDSTTGVFLARRLREKCPLTVITNFRPVMDAVRDVPDLTLISLGGQYVSWCNGYMGSVTLRALDQLRADLFFMSAPALDEEMTFHQHHEAVLVKEASYRSAKRSVLFADHSKFSERALLAMIPTADFDTVILDENTPEEIVSRMTQAHVNVVLAPVNQPAAADLGA